jgi:hypothetical protein
MFRLILSLAFASLISSCEGLLLSELSYNGNFKPGDHQQIKISLVNEKENPELINFKLCDYACNAEGEHFFEEPSSSFQRSNSQWIHLSKNRVTLQPKETSDYFLTIKIPQDPSLKGSYWSVILVEPENPINTIGDTKGFQLNIKMRFAYHVITTINEGTAKIQILQAQIKQIDDKNQLCIDVKNIGDVYLNPKMTLKLFNNSGKLEKTLLGQTERLYPGNSQRYFVDGEGLKGKKYTAFFLLDNGDKHLFGETLELNLQ